MSDNPAFDRIQAELDESSVVLFMKGSPLMPQCGFSAAVSTLLSNLQVSLKASMCFRTVKSARASRNSPIGPRSPNFM